MKINFIFKDYESEIYKNDQEVERSSAFWWWFDLIEFLMILFRGLFFETMVNWVFWVFWEPKGQLISKCLFGVFNSPKKWTKTIGLKVPLIVKWIFFRLFRRRIEDTKKTFRN